MAFPENYNFILTENEMGKKMGLCFTGQKIALWSYFLNYKLN